MQITEGRIRHEDKASTSRYYWCGAGRRTIVARTDITHLDDGRGLKRDAADCIFDGPIRPEEKDTRQGEGDAENVSGGTHLRFDALLIFD